MISFVVEDSIVVTVPVFVITEPIFELFISISLAFVIPFVIVSLVPAFFSEFFIVIQRNLRYN